MKGQTEIWKSHPDILGIEVSTFGIVRTLDRVVSSEKRTDLIKGRISKQYDNGRGYLNVSIPIDGKWTKKAVHRLVAQTFIPNPDNLPEANHKDGDRTNNNASNLEWCSHSYNIQYRDNCGHTAKNNAPKSPVYAINLSTMEALRFHSQSEAGRAIGVSPGNINYVIQGKRKQTGGYWLVNADDKAADLTKHKLHEIGKTKLTAADEASADFVSLVLAE